MKFKTLVPLLGFLTMFGGLSPAQAQTAADKATEATTLEQVQQDAAELMESIKGYSAEQRDEALADAQEGLDSLDREIDALETRIDKNWDEMDQAAREQARESLRALRKQRTELAQWYGEWKNSSADAWDEVKKGFSEAYQSLSDSWGEAVTEFDETTE
ncbi:hypothetical protein O4H49_02845 [Kiloniella laminariae]|uniref:Uncharacterized protein n=1 Tax=Kiloniella laminariae TaxID=454162 RepID=A0ABT4LF21_9PROT|nr:hypothetical protein [Kiloniella laminariae]MCZ4279700.1 hypothetical protein [Kiloniella laminariae]